jgi:hypothetical protein
MLAMGIDEVFRVSAVAPGGDDQQASDWILEVDGIAWSDCGQPAGVEAVLARHRSRASMPAPSTEP